VDYPIRSVVKSWTLGGARLEGCVLKGTRLIVSHSDFFIVGGIGQRPRWWTEVQMPEIKTINCKNLGRESKYREINLSYPALCVP